MRSFALVLLVLAFPAQAEEESEAPATPALTDTRVLSCSPTSLHPGESLTLTLGPSHGKELAIQGPRKEQIYLLVVGSPPKDDPQLMSTHEFARARHVTISTSVLARSWVANGQIERVFTTPGTYTIYVSENLESEVGGYVCDVRYTP